MYGYEVSSTCSLPKKNTTIKYLFGALGFNSNANFRITKAKCPEDIFGFGLTMEIKTTFRWLFFGWVIA